MRANLFKGASYEGGISRCEHCNAVCALRSIITLRADVAKQLGKRKLAVCPACAAELPKRPIKIKPGKPSRSIQL